MSCCHCADLKLTLISVASESRSSKNFRHTFANLTERHSNVIRIAESESHLLQRMANAIPSNAELSNEGSRLDHAFYSLAQTTEHLVSKSNLDRINLGDAAYCELLVTACSALDSFGSDAIENALKEFELPRGGCSAVEVHSDDPLEVGVGPLIECSWRRDHLAVLEAKECFLDEVCTVPNLFRSRYTHFVL